MMMTRHLWLTTTMHSAWLLPQDRAARLATTDEQAITDAISTDASVECVIKRGLAALLKNDDLWDCRFETDAIKTLSNTPPSSLSPSNDRLYRPTEPRLHSVPLGPVPPPVSEEILSAIALLESNSP